MVVAGEERAPGNVQRAEMPTTIEDNPPDLLRHGPHELEDGLEGDDGGG